MDDLVSIIVPVYNVEKYLGKCLKSILRQTYSPVEVILVDDGATDESGRICDKYAARDSRIVVIHQQNGGLSAARNAGIDAARGAYYAFVDSDDYILPDMIEKLAALCTRFNADIAMCAMRGPEVAGNTGGIKVMRRDEYMPLILKDVIPSYMCNKLFRCVLFEGIRFPLGMVAEDMAIAHRLFNAAQIVAQTDEPLYVYCCERPDNISHSGRNWIIRSYHRAVVFRDRYEFAHVHYPQVCGDLLGQMVHYYASAYAKMLMEKSGYDGEMADIRRAAGAYRSAAKRAGTVSLLKKFVFGCIADKRHVPLIVMTRLFMLLGRIKGGYADG